MKPAEVEALNPVYWRRIVRLEARAAPRLKTCEGLWRSTVKGCRGATPRPGSMTQFIREKRLLPADEIDEIWTTTPPDIQLFQDGYAAALEQGREGDYAARATAPDYRVK